MILESICRIVIFQIGTGYFGMEIARIEEIIEKTNAIAAPSEKTSNVDGILNWHEDMIPRCIIAVPMSGTSDFIVHKRTVFPMGCKNRWQDSSYI